MQLRVNIRQVRALVYLLCFAALAAWGLVFWDIYQGREGDRYDANSFEYYGTVFRSQLTNATIDLGGSLPPEDKFDALWTARIDGSVPEIAEPDRPEPGGDVAPEDEPVEPIDSVLTVNLVMHHPEPVHRLVAITYNDPTVVGLAKERRLHLTEGDLLLPPYDGPPYYGQVLEIGLQEVKFAWGKDGEATLTPSLGREGDGPTLAEFEVSDAPDVWEGYTEIPEESVEVDDGNWLLGTRDLERIRSRPEDVLAESVTVRTIHKPDGGRTELEVTEVEPGSLAAQYGVEAGDRIIAVNGIPMPSVSAAINWAKENSDLPTYVVEIMRRGQPMKIVFNVKS